MAEVMSIFSEIMIATNVRLRFVDEEDKEAYITDYLKACKESRYTKIVVDEQNGEKFVEVSQNIITGVVCKQL